VRKTYHSVFVPAVIVHGIPAIHYVTVATAAPPRNG